MALKTKAILVNKYEKITDQLLTSKADERGGRLLPKVRLADAIDVDKVTARAKDYALRAHLDFVMVDVDTSEPRFAVELDGAQHFSDQASQERDRIKDQLCESAGLPLLRITSDLTRRKGRWVVLAYLVEAFYLAEAFYDAQEQGIVPWDEPFDIGSFITGGDDGRIMFNTLDAAAAARIWEHYEAKRLPHFSCDTYVTALGEQRAVIAHSFMAVAPQRYLVSRVRVRDFRFQGISPSELASQLSAVEIGDLAEDWLAGRPAAGDARELARAMREVQRNIDAGGFLRSAAGGALRAGGPIDSSIVIKIRGDR